MAEAGMEPTLLNYGRGASWRNIAGGRTAFSLPEIADIATKSHQIFKEINKISDIDYRPINYVNFAHDEATYKALEASMAWSNARMIEPKDFQRISRSFTLIYPRGNPCCGSEGCMLRPDDLS
jgi:glycine/D-amino acid oxidase-like deaminating enzyme